jgi:hypothetical protein
VGKEMILDGFGWDYSVSHSRFNVVPILLIRTGQSHLQSLIFTTLRNLRAIYESFESQQQQRPTSIPSRWIPNRIDLGALAQGPKIGHDQSD